MILNNISKDNIVSFIDACGFFFFIVLAFFISISTAAVESTFGFILLCFILRTIVKRPTWEETKDFFSKKINFYLLLFYIAIGLSMLVSGPLWAKSFRAWTTKWGEGVALFYCAQIFLNKKRIRIILLAMIASAFLVSIDGIYQKIVGIDFLRGRPVVVTDRLEAAVNGTFNHYNDFAAFLGALIFIVIGFLGHVKKAYYKIPLVLIFALITVNVFFALSRGAWISLIIVCLFSIVFIKKKRNKLFFILLLLGFITVVLKVPLLKDRFLTILTKGGDADRFKIWRLSLVMFQESPLFGKGLGLFMSHFSGRIKLFVQYTHNCYLQILTESGLLGFVSFIWFLGAIMSQGYKKLRQRPEGIFFGLFAGLCVFLIHSFFDTQLYSVRLSLLFWLLASFTTVYLLHYDCKEV